VDISTTEYKRVAVVAVSGRVDSATSGELEMALKALLEKGASNIVLDFSGVDFLSSSGLRVMVTTRKALKEAGGEVVIAQPSERVKETLELAGLVHVDGRHAPHRLVLGPGPDP